MEKAKPVCACVFAFQEGDNDNEQAREVDINWLVYSTGRGMNVFFIKCCQIICDR